MNIPDDFQLPYLTTLVVSALLIPLAWHKPKVARILFAVIFIGAAIANTIMVVTEPSQYVDPYRDFALLDLYRDFIDGFFRRYTIPVVVLIAVGQLTVGLLLLARRQQLFNLGFYGAILFFVAISPLGIGAAFPAPLLMAVAIGVLPDRLKHSRDESARP